MLGDWNAADGELTPAVDSDGLSDINLLTCYRGWLAALRGDAATAETMLAGLGDLRASEDPQDIAMIGLVEAFTETARRQPLAALSSARRALAHADALFAHRSASHSPMLSTSSISASTARPIARYVIQQMKVNETLDQPGAASSG